MRPTPVLQDPPPGPHSRSRKPSASASADSSTTAPGPIHVAPTSYFLKSEAELEEAQTRQADSTFGVQSLEDALGAAFGPGSSPAGGYGDVFEGVGVAGRKRKKTANTNVNTNADVAKDVSAGLTSRASSQTPGDAYTTSPPRGGHARRTSAATISQPLTPMDIGTPLLPDSAMPGTPKSGSLRSLRLSDEESNVDDAASQAIASSGEDEDDGDVQADEAARSGSIRSAPELVMPSITMPKRRPFTSRGRNMGRLKIMVAGGRGVGKSSLVRSVVRVCEDIVHVDPMDVTAPSIASSDEQKRLRKKSSVTDATTEVHASTRAYPSWWSEMEEGRGLRRRRSTGDTVLERNLCFVDTPGYGISGSTSKDVDSVVRYIEALLYKNASVAGLGDGDLLGVLTGNGGVQVDVVLYLFSHDNISEDVDYFNRLTELTNVIPLISKSDTLTPSALTKLKQDILNSFYTTPSRPFLFGRSVSGILDTLETASTLLNSAETPRPNPSSPPDDPFSSTLSPATEQPVIPPYAVSSAPSPDTETMDASLLMSPDYISPLLPSELHALIQQLFEPDNISWLRHSAVKKFIVWRRKQLRTDSMAMTAITNPRSEARTLSPTPTSGYLSALARRTSPQNREGQLFESVRLEQWARDLQAPFRREQDHYAALQRGERARWLLERVGEEIRRGNIAAGPEANTSAAAGWSLVEHDSEKNAESLEAGYGYARWARRGQYNGRNLDVRDPLGLCGFGDGLRRGSAVVLRVLGGVGVLGAVALAFARVWWGANWVESLGWHGGGAWTWNQGPAGNSWGSWWGGGE